MIRVREALVGSRTRLVGPNSQGILAPDVCQIGVMATGAARPGNIGIAARSASSQRGRQPLTAVGLGQSTTVGIGGDQIHGIGFAYCIKEFFADPGTTVSS